MQFDCRKLILVRRGVLVLSIAFVTASTLTACSSPQVSKLTGRVVVPTSQHPPYADPLKVPSVPVDQILEANVAKTSLVTPPGTGDLLPAPNVAAGTVATVGPWVLSLTAGDKQYLLIGTRTAQCYSLWKIAVSVNRTRAVITPWLTSPKKNNESCEKGPSIGHLWLVDLGSPLGHRTLLHPRVTAEFNS